MISGKVSRPVLYRTYNNDTQQYYVAQLVNVRITLDQGKVTDIEWINVCDGLACEKNQCVDTNERWLGKIYKESNCFLRGCVSSSNGKCDTKTYVTWRGTDRQGRVLTSDNYRLSNFMDYSINTLIASASNIGENIYNKLFNHTI